MTARRPSVDREVQRRLRGLWRTIGNDIQRTRIDIAASQAAVASEAGMDRSHLTRIEAGLAHPSLESLVAIAIAMGADLSIRVYAGRGPLLTDRHSARMVETTIRQLAPVWRPHLEVHVTRPIRGYIDAVLERRDQRLFVVAEFESVLPRLEQQLRWAAEKAAAIASSDLVGPGPPPRISRLLVLRSTERTRSLARTFASVLRTAYRRAVVMLSTRSEPARRGRVIRSSGFGSTAMTSSSSMRLLAACQSADEADQPLTASISIAIIGRDARSWSSYCGYLARSAATTAGSLSASSARPAIRSHTSFDQSSDQRSTSSATRGSRSISRTLANARGSEPCFGFSSRGDHTTSSITTQQMGTSLGRPSGAIVASVAVRAAPRN